MASYVVHVHKLLLKPGEEEYCVFGPFRSKLAADNAIYALSQDYCAKFKVLVVNPLK